MAILAKQEARRVDARIAGEDRRLNLLQVRAAGAKVVAGQQAIKADVVDLVDHFPFEPEMAPIQQALAALGANQAAMAGAQARVLATLGDVADRPDRFEATILCPPRRSEVADVTLRRPRRFKPAPGVTYAWTNTGGGQGRYAIKQSGVAAAGADGLLTLPGVQFAAEGSRLVIVPK